MREGLLDKTNTASSVWADTAYRSKANEEFMDANGFVSRVHRKKPKGRPMARRTAIANGRKSTAMSSTSLPNRSREWACSSARSALPAPR